LAWTIAAAAATTAVGFTATFLEARRQAELEFVNNQIERLYGPLYALTRAGEDSWNTFRSKNRPGGWEYFEGPPLRDAEVLVWRRWMREVTQPRNLKMSAAIVDNAQLAIGDDVPMAFIDLITHTDSYAGLIAGWDDEVDQAECALDQQCSFRTRSANEATNDFPTQLNTCVREDYLKLKALQQKLKSTLVIVSSPVVIRSASCD
jgi:hypothetical protein